MGQAGRMGTGNAMGRTALQSRRYEKPPRKSTPRQNFTITEATITTINSVGTSFIIR